MTSTAPAPLVLVGAGRGVSLIPQPTPLTRLNYFDGKFLRADDLAREQAYLRGLVHLSNRAGGSGVVGARGRATRRRRYDRRPAAAVAGRAGRLGSVGRPDAGAP